MTNLSPQTIPDYDNLTASQQRRHSNLWERICEALDDVLVPSDSAAEHALFDACTVAIAQEPTTTSETNPAPAVDKPATLTNVETTIDRDGAQMILDALEILNPDESDPAAKRRLNKLRALFRSATENMRQDDSYSLVLADSESRTPRGTESRQP
jgi:hypothetical protein